MCTFFFVEIKLDVLYLYVGDWKTQLVNVWNDVIVYFKSLASK